ncbi:MAG: FHA domain-containing protein [Cyanobacteria bacterium J06638_28]
MITLSLLHPLNKTPVQHWTFEEESVIRIGRSTENDVVLYSAVVSRHHVELRKTGSSWEIVNMGTNGTYLEGKRVSQVAAHDGTIIRLARSGPNIQINLGQEGSAAVQALLRLRADAVNPNKDVSVASPTAQPEVDGEKKTAIHAGEETVTPQNEQVPEADDTPTSGSSAS